MVEMGGVIALNLLAREKELEVLVCLPNALGLILCCSLFFLFRRSFKLHCVLLLTVYDDRKLP